MLLQAKGVGVHNVQCFQDDTCDDDERTKNHFSTSIITTKSLSRFSSYGTSGLEIKVDVMDMKIFEVKFFGEVFENANVPTLSGDQMHQFT